MYLHTKLTGYYLVLGVHTNCSILSIFNYQQAKNWDLYRYRDLFSSILAVFLYRLMHNINWILDTKSYFAIIHLRTHAFFKCSQ